MPYPTHAIDDQAEAGQLVDQPMAHEGQVHEARYGVVVRDIFSDGGWTQAEPVRARDWRDNGWDARVQWSETSLD